MDAYPGEAAARSALEAVDPGITWRPLGREDLAAVTRFYAEVEAHDRNPDRRSLSALEEYWDSPRSRPDEDTLVGHDGSRDVVAVAWAGCNRSLTDRRGVRLAGAVRPDRRGRGLGRAVLRWEVAHGLTWDDATRKPGHGALVMRLLAPADQADVRDLAERHGLAVERYFFDMSRPVADPPPAPELDGVRIVGWDAARSRETHHAVDRAFRDHWGHADRTDEMWDDMLRSHDFRAEWSLLAVDTAGGAVVGAALNCAYEQDWAATGVTEGYTDELAVVRSHRGRGIASALLTESMRRFAESGMEAAALTVDTANPTGALRLYEQLGYRQTTRTCIHQLVRPRPADVPGPPR